MFRRCARRLAAAAEGAEAKKASSAGSEKAKSKRNEGRGKGKKEQEAQTSGQGYTEPKEWVKLVRAKTPVLLEPGKPSPKLVLSFGGAGWLVSYSLGVAKFLQTEKKKLLNQSYLLGAGTGVIPVMCLAAGPEKCNIDKLLDFMLDDLFDVTNEPKRLERTEAAMEEFFPDDIHKVLSGRAALTIGFSNRDAGYMRQGKEQIYFGNHVSTFESKQDVMDLTLAAMCPNSNHPCDFRDADNVMRGTMFTMSSELDQYCRHVHVHGYAANGRNRHQSRHNYFYGRHGLIVNTHAHWLKQAWYAFVPTKGSKSSMQEVHKEAFENGFHDARRFERWEEDPYHFAKPDRSASDDFNWKTIRASLIGRKPGEKFEL